MMGREDMEGWGCWYLLVDEDAWCKKGDGDTYLLEWVLGMLRY